MFFPEKIAMIYPLRYTDNEIMIAYDDKTRFSEKSVAYPNTFDVTGRCKSNRYIEDIEKLLIW